LGGHRANDGPGIKGLWSAAFDFAAIIHKRRAGFVDRGLLRRSEEKQMSQTRAARGLSDDVLYKALLGALEKAGHVVLKYFLNHGSVIMKGPVDPVTVADKSADREIQRYLQKRFPGHGFLTEESIPRVNRSDYRWIIDPLDGTVNYAHGVPHACVSIGLEVQGRVRMGGILDPFRRELFTAVRGRGTRLNGQVVGVSRTDKLQNALLATGFPYDRQKRAGFYTKFYQKFLGKSRDIRRMGAAALDMAYVACGRYDGYWEFNIHAWDSAAGIVLVEEAGGRVSDYGGRPYDLSDTRQTLCSNGYLHAAMLKTLGSF
jgi:myo-inositol-1(or 4)-monophosphatase